MDKAWKLFIMVELLLFLTALYQISRNEAPVLLFLIIAVLNILYVIRKKKRRNTFNQIQLTLGIVFVIVSLLSAFSIWIMLAFAIIFISVRGVEISGVKFFQQQPYQSKKIILPEFVASEPKSGRKFKRKWFGNERIGDDVYEWDDINFILMSGDTIVDLGNTFLPKDDNVIMIRKGFGRTRILVPVGIGVMLEHSTLLGKVNFEEEHLNLRNESVKLYSDEYDQNLRRLKIVTSTLLGDVEVIRI